MSLSIIPNATQSTPAILALGTFLFAYVLVIFEEFIQLRKSKPLLLASGIIWMLVAIVANQKGIPEIISIATRQNLLEYAELLLFIIVAITYINVLTEFKIFDVLGAWLTQNAFSYKQLFWITGFLAFFISSIADNLTTALAMSAVILAIGKDNSRFAGIACINLVVAANAGGVFSPFGDITTLMVWQAGIVSFSSFFKLFFPSLLSFLIPSLCMHFSIPKGRPQLTHKKIVLPRGAKRILLLFIITIMTTVYLHHNFYIPPAIGMMLGLAFLQFFAYYTKHRENIHTIEIFPAIKELDWDTLLFFYGIMLSIGGLATLGYLEVFSQSLYSFWDFNLSQPFQQTPGNIMIGILSAIIDNIPLMFSVITTRPDMSEGQWLLLTLTAGIGGSLLSVGSAAGIAVMGHARGAYTFFRHLKWIWAIALGYAASIALHLWLNAELFYFNKF